MKRRDFLRATAVAGLGSLPLLGGRVVAGPVDDGPETFNCNVDLHGDLPCPYLAARNTGERLDVPRWFYADSRAGIIRCYRRVPSPVHPNGLRYLATPDGRRVRNGWSYRRPDGTWTEGLAGRWEAENPDGTWEPWIGEAEPAWEEVRVSRPFRIVLPERVAPRPEG